MALCVMWQPKQSDYVLSLSGDDVDLSIDVTNHLGDSLPVPKEYECLPQHTSTPNRASQQNKWRNRSLRILNTNIRSVHGKKVELGNAVESLKPDIIILTETHLEKKIKSSEFLDTDVYEVYRDDRNRSG